MANNWNTISNLFAHLESIKYQFEIGDKMEKGIDMKRIRNRRVKREIGTSIEWTSRRLVSTCLNAISRSSKGMVRRMGRYEEISKARSNPFSLSFSSVSEYTCSGREEGRIKKIKGDISQRRPRRNTLTRWEIRDWFRLNCVFRLNPLALTERFSPLRGSITRTHRYLGGEGESTTRCHSLPSNCRLARSSSTAISKFRPLLSLLDLRN